jgi:hypothetical protein
MTQPHDIERVLERWFVDGVDEMPDRTYLAVLDRVDRQSQRPAWRLRPWRSTPMPVIVRIALVAALLAIVAGGGAILIGSRLQSVPQTPALPTEGPGTTPLPDLSATFRSTRYSVSFRYPGTWNSVHDATTNWISTEPQGPDPIDEVSPDDYASGFSVVGEGLLFGQSAEDWYQAYINAQAPNANGKTCVPPRSTWQPTTVAGLPALTYDTSPCNFHEIVLVRQGAVYLFDFSPPDYVYSAADEALFRSILDTVRFVPIATPSP